MNVEHGPARDAALDAVWREHSREMPPQHLDQAIVAAAHRAVGSVPQDSVASSATRPQRWWMPLAAAAAIGAIAVGLLQVTPPQELVVAPPVHEATLPSTGARDATDAAKLRESGQDAQISEQTAAATPQSVDERALTREQRNAGRSPERDTDRSVERSARRREVPAARTPAGREQGAAESDSLATGHAPAVAKSLARSDAAVTPAPAPMLAPPSAAAPVPMLARPPAAASAPAPAPTPIESYAPTPSGRIAPAPQRQQPMRDQVRESEALGAAASRAESPLLAKTSLTPEEARAWAREPDAWIARIRRLREEGQTVAAVRELAAFRATVSDAERRVPSDLREWAATVAR